MIFFIIHKQICIIYLPILFLSINKQTNITLSDKNLLLLIIVIVVLLIFHPYLATVYFIFKWCKEDSEEIKLIINNRIINYYLISFGFIAFIALSFIVGYIAHTELWAILIPFVIYFFSLYVFRSFLKITNRFMVLSTGIFLHTLLLYIFQIFERYKSNVWFG